MEKKDVYAYTPTVNIEKYEKLDSEERKDYLSLDKRMHRITEGFAYDVGKVLRMLKRSLEIKGEKIYSRSQIGSNRGDLPGVEHIS